MMLQGRIDKIEFDNIIVVTPGNQQKIKDLLKGELEGASLSADVRKQAIKYVNKQIEVAKRVQVYPNVAMEAGLEQEKLITTLVNSGLSKKNAGILVANAIEGTNLPQNPKYISLSRIKSVLTSVKDAHRGTKAELKEKTDAVMEAMFLSNVMIIQKWSEQFEDYDIKNDEEEDNQYFRGQYLNRNNE